MGVEEMSPRRVRVCRGHLDTTREETLRFNKKKRGENARNLMRGRVRNGVKRELFYKADGGGRRRESIGRTPTDTGNDVITVKEDKKGYLLRKSNRRGGGGFMDVGPAPDCNINKIDQFV